MKAKDLIRTLEMLPDYDVVISLHSPSVGPRACAAVNSAGTSCDWDHGKIFLSSKELLVKKTDKEHAFDLAVAFLMWLATKPNKKQTYEIREAREILDSAGIEYMKYAAFLHQEK